MGQHWAHSSPRRRNCISLRCSPQENVYTAPHLVAVSGSGGSRGGGSSGGGSGTGSSSGGARGGGAGPHGGGSSHSGSGTGSSSSGSRDGDDDSRSSSPSRDPAKEHEEREARERAQEAQRWKEQREEIQEDIKSADETAEHTRDFDTKRNDLAEDVAQSQGEIDRQQKQSDEVAKGGQRNRGAADSNQQRIDDQNRDMADQGKKSRQNEQAANDVKQQQGKQSRELDEIAKARDQTPATPAGSGPSGPDGRPKYGPYNPGLPDERTPLQDPPTSPPTGNPADAFPIPVNPKPHEGVGILGKKRTRPITDPETGLNTSRSESDYIGGVAIPTDLLKPLGDSKGRKNLYNKAKNSVKDGLKNVAPSQDTRDNVKNASEWVLDPDNKLEKEGQRVVDNAREFYDKMVWPKVEAVKITKDELVSAAGTAVEVINSFKQRPGGADRSEKSSTGSGANGERTAKPKAPDRRPRDDGEARRSRREQEKARKRNHWLRSKSPSEKQRITNKLKDRLGPPPKDAVQLKQWRRKRDRWIDSQMWNEKVDEDTERRRDTNNGIRA